MAIVKDEVLNEFQKNLPCVDCKLASICKYAGSIVPPVSNLPETFEVHYVCKEKEKYN